MARLAVAVLLLELLLGTGCSGLRRDGARPPVSRVAAAVVVDAARSMADLLEVVFWRAPKLLLVELPVWLFYELPRSLLLSASPEREQVARLVDGLGESASMEERVAAVERLRELTGLPLEDAGAWREWWATASGRPESAWRRDLADRCLAELESEDFLARQRADTRLRALSGRDVGYDPKGSPAERADGLASWRAWMESAFGRGGDR